MRPFLLLALVGCQAPEWGAQALLHPARRASHGIPDGSQSFEADADGLVLQGWWAKAQLPRRGLILWLHGVGDNKDSAGGLAHRWTERGFDVAAYDSRAHGASGGELCTYGYHEKHDVQRVLDVLQKAGADSDRTVLMGFSMGAAVALQAAPLDGRIRAVVALAPFAELAEAAARAAPFWMRRKSIDQALQLAEKQGRFSVSEVSPRKEVARLFAPLLLIHGRRDGKLPPGDSQAILAAAPALDKRLVLVDADHDNLLGSGETWKALDQFLDRVAPLR